MMLDGGKTDVLRVAIKFGFDTMENIGILSMGDRLVN